MENEWDQVLLPAMLRGNGMIETGFIIGAAIAIFGALVGVKIRRITKFLYPFDFLTGIVIIVLVALIISVPLIGMFTGLWEGSLIDTAGYGSFVIGYLFGYCIDGFRAYFIIRRRIPKVKNAPGEPCVTYKVDGRWAWAGQTNGYLWERLVHKNHIFIICKTPFGEADWDEPTKYPLFPIFDRPMMMVDKFGVVDVVYRSDAGKEKHRPRRAFLVLKAHGSQVSIDQLCFEEDAVRKANEATAEAQQKYTNLLHFVKAGLPRFFANFLASAYDKAPAMAFLEATRRSEEMAQKDEDEEITLKTETEKELKFEPANGKEDKADVRKEERNEEGKAEEGN